MRAVGIRADGWRSTAPAPAPARPWQASRPPELGDGAGRKGIDGFWGFWVLGGVVWCGREGTEWCRRQGAEPWAVGMVGFE